MVFRKCPCGAFARRKLDSSIHDILKFSALAAGASRALALSSAALLFAAPSYAQQSEGDDASLEEITVTGSRIQRSGFTTPVPITTMSTDELRDLDPSNTLSEQLDLLPQFFMSSSAQQGGLAVLGAGQSHLNMRGVGAERTLVLLDGSRIVPSDRSSSVSVDYLPSALMERIDVVTGGASAAYGADALAGVTNFILNRDFEGLSVNTQAGATEWGDGENWQAEAAMGRAFGDRLHVTASLEGRYINGIARGNWPGLEDEVPWDLDWGQVQNPDWNPSDPPGTNVRRLDRPFVSVTNGSPTGWINDRNMGPYNQNIFSADGTRAQPMQRGDYYTFGAGTQQNQASSPDYPLYRAGSPHGFTRAEVKQSSFFLGADYELTEDFTVWGHYLSGNIESNGEGSRGYPGQNSIWHLTIYRENPFLPQELADYMDANGLESFRMERTGGWGPVDGGMEYQIGHHGMDSLTLGFDYTLPGTWALRGSYQYGEAEQDSLLKNYQRIDRSFLAWDAVTDPVTGNPVCNVQLYARGNPNFEAELHAWALANTSIARHDAGRVPGQSSPIDYPVAVDSIDGSISECVPLNPFGLYPASDAAWNYIRSDKPVISTVDQHFAEIVANGELWEGIGAGPFSQAFGASYREESIMQGVKDWFLPLDALGPPLNVPEYGIRGIPSGHSTGSANLHRFSTYPSFEGGFDVWEVFGETIAPLFSNGTQRIETSLAWRYSSYSSSGGIWSYKGGLDFQVYEDLRLRATYSRDVREASFAERFDYQAVGGFITNDPVTGTSYLSTTFGVGNDEIAPEYADTTVLGFVYQPSWLEGFSVSLDWYEIELQDAIGQLTAQQIVDSCAASGLYCEEIDRDPNTGEAMRVFRKYINIDAALVEGVDVEIGYRMDPDFFAGQTESLSLRVLAGYMRENSTTLSDGSYQDTAGTGNLPDWSITAMLNYGIGPFRFGLQSRYVDDAIRNINWVEGVDIANNTLPDAWYHNLRISYDHQSGLVPGDWTASLNINNLFDKEPPSGPNATSGRYDQLGRAYNLSLQYQF